jgi:hypothetical protein
MSMYNICLHYLICLVSDQLDINTDVDNNFYIGDGKIDRNEYIQAMALYGCDRNDASVAFDQCAQVI